MIEMLISITGLPLGSRGRGLILYLYWSLAVVPKSVLQPQPPTGRSELWTCAQHIDVDEHFDWYA